MKWLNSNQIMVEPPKRPKKITGTRFASVLELDRWNTPFKTWCAISRVYEEPFEDNKYTRAGKIIEPKIIEYLNKVYFLGALKTPTDVYGPDYFKSTWGDFFPDSPIFGGMWDAIVEDEEGGATVEIKTTKRVEDWSKGAPDYYALQGALYSYLRGCDRVIMVVAFLEEKDYEHPELFVPSSENIFIDDFRISERYPQFERHIARAQRWWNDHVFTGISPEYDEKKDADILAILRKNTISPETDIMNLIEEAEMLKEALEKSTAQIAEAEKRLKTITELVKEHCQKQFRPGDTKVCINGPRYEWTLSKSVGIEIDKTALKRDGLLEKYSIQKENYRMTLKKKEESA